MSDCSACFDPTQEIGSTQQKRAVDAHDRLRDIPKMEETVGKRLVAKARSKGWNIAALALELGVTTETIRKWQRGDTEPNRNQRKLISDKLGVSEVWVLFGGDEGQPARTPSVSLSQALDVLSDELAGVNKLARQNARNALMHLIDNIDEASEVEIAKDQILAATSTKQRAA